MGVNSFLLFLQIPQMVVNHGLSRQDVWILPQIWWN